MSWITNLSGFDDMKLINVYQFNRKCLDYVTWTRLGVSSLGTDPSVGYDTSKKSGHGDSVRILDTGTGMTKLIFYNIKFNN